MKLRSLHAGAQLASRNFLEQRAPVLCRSVGLSSTPFRAVIFTSKEHEAAQCSAVVECCGAWRSELKMWKVVMERVGELANCSPKSIAGVPSLTMPQLRLLNLLNL